MTTHAHDLNNKRILVVGGTQGIGYGAAHALAKRGASLVIAGRNEERGPQVALKLKELSPNKDASIEFTRVDLADQADLKRFAKELANERFDHIVWTAGRFAVGARKETADGVEVNFATNYLSRFIGFNLLLPTLKKGGRLLSVFAPFEALHAPFAKQFNINDVQTKEQGKWEELGLEKLNIVPSIANDLLIRRLAQQDKEHVFLHQQPGYIITNLFANSGIEPKDSPFDLSKFVGKSPEEYGETAVYLLTDASVAELSGKGIKSDGTAYDDNKYVKDAELVEKMWQYSTKVANL